MIINNSLLKSLKVQNRIIGALLMREILTRYGRHNIGFMWLFVEPMMFSLGVLGLWTMFGLHKTVLPIVPFCLIGYGSVILWRNTISKACNAIEPNRALLHHRNVRVIDLFISRIILEISGATISFLFLILFFIAMGAVSPPQDILKIISGWFLLAWFASGLALLLGSLSELSEVVDRIWHVFSYLFLPMSGAFFLVEWLPRSFQQMALYVPTVNCVELLREGLFGQAAHSHYDISYVVIFNLCLFLPALFLVSYVAGQVEGE